MLTIYSKTICPKCIHVKRELKGKGIDFKEVNLDHDEESLEMLKSKNLQGLPVLTIENGLINDMSQILSWIDSK